MRREFKKKREGCGFLGKICKERSWRESGSVVFGKLGTAAEVG